MIYPQLFVKESFQEGSKLIESMLVKLMRVSDSQWKSSFSFLLGAFVDSSHFLSTKYEVRFRIIATCRRHSVALIMQVAYLAPATEVCHLLFSLRQPCLYTFSPSVHLTLNTDNRWLFPPSQLEHGRQSHKHINSKNLMSFLSIIFVFIFNYK